MIEYNKKTEIRKLALIALDGNLVAVISKCPLNTKFARKPNYQLSTINYQLNPTSLPPYESRRVLEAWKVGDAMTEMDTRTSSRATARVAPTDTVCCLMIRLIVQYSSFSYNRPLWCSPQQRMKTYRITNK